MIKLVSPDPEYITPILPTEPLANLAVMSPPTFTMGKPPPMISLMSVPPIEGPVDVEM